ncbi:MAG: filamentous hemagglutinin N-terminal domain-containing protein [Hassallia sp. WJT32-NPBG1]|jgi:filamentous hemagglutinin family protein|nr:filamentous hemagglutinin N-terminal domain-containing protein [Hassallia sp. WJT32-NPBG1]
MTKNCKYLELAVILALGGMFATATSVLAQSITTDGTLPNNSNVIVRGNTFNITGGTQAGRNLFHSFQEFSVPTGGAAFFNNALDIQNIISRVTGGSVSNIDGLLRANGSANLFLINPNGVIFGPNAALNVGGSLAVSTANAIQFGEQGFFSATPANSPPLLTVNPSAFFFNQITPGNIQVQGQTGEVSQVAAGRSLTLLGGNILVDGGTFNAQGGRVELGGLAKAGTVGINFNNNDFSLAFPPQVERADIQLSNGATVNVIARDGRSIAIKAKNLLLSEGSNLFSGVGNNLGTVDTQAGDIIIDTTGVMALTDNSAIGSSVESDAIGNSGNINIKTGSLSLDNDSRLFANTNGRGNAANISIQADGLVALRNDSFILNWVGFGGRGNGGDINIRAGSVAVINGSRISTSTSLRGGNAGDININVLYDVLLAGVGSNGFRSAVFSSNTSQQAIGRGGNITFKTGRLQVRDGAQVSTSTFGTGDAGSLNLIATNAVELVGTSPDGQFASGVNSGVLSTGARGRGGDLNFTTKRLLIRDGAQVSTATFGRGNAGRLKVSALDVELVGTSADGQFVSGLTSAVRGSAVGRGGNLNFTTERLLIRDGAQISTATSGLGNAGNLTVNALDSVELVGTSGDGKFASSLTSAVESGGVGNGGSLKVDVGSLSLSNGAQISAAVRGASGSLPGGRGTGGQILINASDSVNLAGVGGNAFSSGLFTNTGRGASGSAGEIFVNTGAFRIADGAIVTAQTLNSSDAGEVAIKANSFEAINGGQVLTTTGSAGNAGNILLDVRDNITFSGSDSTFAARLAQFGGDVVNESPASGLFASTDANSTGNGGNITIDPIQLKIVNGAIISASSLGTGDAGSVQAEANSIILNQGQITAQSTIGRGGNIALRGDLVLLSGNSLLSTVSGTSQAVGNAGNISIDADFLIALENSNIIADAFAGPGANITINAQGILFSEDSSIVSNGRRIEVPPIVELLTDLPMGELIDTSTQIISSCDAFGKGGSEFTVTGRGGLPPSPDEPLSSDVVWSDTRLTALPVSSSPRVTPSVRKTSSGVAIVPATGWVFDKKKGEVTLIASNATSSGVGSNQVKCVVP